MAEENKQLDNLFAELGLENLSDEEKADFLAKVGELLQKRVLVRIVENMDEAQQADFEKFLEEETDQEKINQYLEEKVPNLDEIVEEEVKAVRNDILEHFKSE